jgi:hypothetical protein
MNKLVLSLAIALLLHPVCGEEVDLAKTDGVYKMCDEVSGYSGETLELKGGKFRYWFYSDAGGGEETYPMVGKYVREGNKLRIQDERVFSGERVLSVVNGQVVIWRRDGLKLWREETKIKPYAVLIRVPEMAVKDPWLNRPSIKSLYSPEMLKREEDAYQNRYEETPEPLRSLMRAATKRDDPDLREYKSEIRKARDGLNERIVGQLVSMMGADNGLDSIKAGSALGRLYESDWLIPESPKFMSSEIDRRAALNLLIDAMSEAKSRRALDSTLVIFLRVSKVGNMDLAIPAAGVHIRLSAPPGGGYTDASGLIKGSEIWPKDSQWTAEIDVIAEACESWCRSSF